MSYISFDKRDLQNIGRTLSKEILNTNRTGVFSISSLIGCNTRKYHGLLTLPIEGTGLDDGNYVLLSSLDETVVQYGAEFNLAVHHYGYDIFAPNGHKYIREFDCVRANKITYRVGSVIIVKERLLVSFEPRVLIRYTMLEAGSGEVKLRLRPLLAFRNVNELTHQNDRANANMDEIPNGRKICMYNGFPTLYMQLSRKTTYCHEPHWYNGIKYYKEEERGYEFREDLLQPGYFEVPLKVNESVIFSAGVSEVPATKLRTLWAKEEELRPVKENMFDFLANSAQQFYKRKENKCYLLAGYPWFNATAREQFFSVCACTMAVGRPDYWKAIIDDTAVHEIKDFIAGKQENIGLQELDEPDALLWFIRSIQEYKEYKPIEEIAKKYGKLIFDVIAFVKSKHPRVQRHANGLLWVNGIDRPATWMNAVENGRPITPRTGYVVEINALWYNALKFAHELATCLGDEKKADMFDYDSVLVQDGFVKVFWNGNYLYDYVIDSYCDREVRPNQIWSVSLPYSPLDYQQQKKVVDICTKELLTPKGLRTLSPKSGNYRPFYVGSQTERNHNYHNGPVWPLTIAAYGVAYLRVYKKSGEGFLKRILDGYEADLRELCIGTINELYDGNPPFRGHGAISYAPSVEAVIRLYQGVQKMINKEEEV